MRLPIPLPLMPPSTPHIPPNLASKGVVNSADATKGLVTMDWNWYLDNEDDIVETVNGIFAG